jgi:ribonuclease P protein component
LQPFTAARASATARNPLAVGAPATPEPIMSPASSERLGRDRRLRGSREFELLKASGRAHRGRHCLLLALARPGEPTLVGFIASKRGVGGAVQRNRARRRLREIVRRRFPRLPATGYWLGLVAFRSALTAPHQDLASDVEQLLAACGALAPIESPGIH